MSWRTEATLVLPATIPSRPEDLTSGAEAVDEDMTLLACVWCWKRSKNRTDVEAIPVVPGIQEL